MLPRQIRRQRAGLERHSRRQRQRCGERGQIRSFGMPQGLRVIAAAAASHAALRAGPGRATRSMTRHRSIRRPRFVLRRRLHRAIPAAFSGRRVQAVARRPRRGSGPRCLPRKQCKRQKQRCGSEEAKVAHAARTRPRFHRSRRGVGQSQADRNLRRRSCACAATTGLPELMASDTRAVPGPCSEIVTHASSRTSDALASAPRRVRVDPPDSSSCRCAQTERCESLSARVATQHRESSCRRSGRATADCHIRREASPHVS